MKLPRTSGYVLATENGDILCRGDGVRGLFLDPFPMEGDVTSPFILCRYRSGAESYAREWRSLGFVRGAACVKPVKVVVEIRPFSKEDKP